MSANEGKALDWERAEKRLEFMEEETRKLAKDPGVNMFFYAGVLAEIRARYEDGERTEALYNRIMDLG